MSLLAVRRSTRNWIRRLGRTSQAVAILSGHTHYDIFASSDLRAAVIPLLDAPSLEPPPVSVSEQFAHMRP